MQKRDREAEAREHARKANSRSERAFLRKRSDYGAAKIPLRYERDNCCELYRNVVETTGLEPATSRVCSERSPS